MSSFVFYKIPFEGKIEVLYDLIKNQDWNILVKVPENGILYMKVPIDVNEEVTFYQNMVFDERTNSKFGIFQTITESDFEAAQNIETPISTETKDVEKTNKSSQKYNNLLDDKIKEFRDKKNKEKNSYLGINLSDLKNIISMPTMNIQAFGKNIYKNYKDPYDYFFSQNYLIALFIFAIICLIIFRF